MSGVSPVAGVQNRAGHSSSRPRSVGSEDNEVIEIYADGASTGEWGVGGWAVVVVFPGEGEGYEFSGSDPNTTNQRMEIEAAIRGLEDVWDLDGDVVVFSDSAYLVNCMNKRWHRKWKKNGWRTYAGNAVANRDMWERLLEVRDRILSQGRQVHWRKVKGFKPSPRNPAPQPSQEIHYRADRLAVAAKKSLQKEVQKK